MNRTPWTADAVALLRKLYPHNSAATLAGILDRPERGIYAKANALGLTKSDAYLSSPAAQRLRSGDRRGMPTRFPKGHIPFNKGVKGWQAGGRSAETRFKPGHRGGKAAALYQPIGAERLSKNGYLERKINDDMPLQRRWRAVHLLLWEAAHGPIPKGHCLQFINGDKADIRLDNLRLVTRAENLRRNSIYNLPPELVAAIRVKGALVRKLNRHERKEAHHA